MSRIAKIGVALGSACLALITAELGLRVFGYHFDLIPTLEFGYPDPVALRSLYQPDRDLIWVPRDYQPWLAAARKAHPDIVFMGDSCTELGTYPRLTMDRLNAPPSARASGAKLAAAGWSSEQGLEQLRRDIIPLHPRIVTVYFGWNDHWVARGLSDEEVADIRWAVTLSRYSRVAQLGLKAVAGAASRRQPQPNRVPLSRYVHNLEALAREAHQAHISPVLITAPSNHAQGAEPKYLAMRHLRRLEELVPLHRAYTDATRKAAEASGAALCDAARAFEDLPGPLGQYFRADGIHMSAEGDRQLAAIVSRCLRDVLDTTAASAR